MEKKLYRSRTDKKICGVCGGLAKYLDMDVSIMRIITLVLVLFAGGGLLAYLLCALVIPQEPGNWVEEGKDRKEPWET